MRRRTLLGALGGMLTVGLGHSLRGRGVTIEPDHGHLDRPGPLGFTLTNRQLSSADLVTSAQTIERRVGETWQRVPLRRQDAISVAEIGPGQSTRLGLATPGSERPDAQAITVLPFGAGEFRFAVSEVDNGPLRAGFSVGGEPLSVSPPDRVTTERIGDRVTVRPETVGADEITHTTQYNLDDRASDPVQVAPEVVVAHRGLSVATFLRREGVTSVFVESTQHYFRTPVEWLDAAGVWAGTDATYDLGGVPVTVTEASQSN